MIDNWFSQIELEMPHPVSRQMNLEMRARDLWVCIQGPDLIAFLGADGEEELI